MLIPLVWYVSIVRKDFIHPLYKIPEAVFMAFFLFLLFLMLVNNYMPGTVKFYICDNFEFSLQPLEIGTVFIPILKMGKPKKSDLSKVGLSVSGRGSSTLT